MLESEGKISTGRKPRLVPKHTPNVDVGVFDEYMKVKGADHQLLGQLRLFKQGGHELDDHTKSSIEALNDYMRGYLGRCDKRTETVYWVRQKDRQASPGEPWKMQCPTFQDLIKRVMQRYQLTEDQAYDKMAKYVDEIDDVISDGTFDSADINMSFDIFSKEDKYKPKKIIAEAYRSIQSCDWVFQVLCNKYVGHWSTKMKDMIPEIAVKASDNRWHDMVGRPVSDKYTFATDITGFDRGISDTLIKVFVDYLQLECSIPKRLATFMFETLSYGMMVMPDGHIMERSGGNPSGQPWTSELNWYVHTLMNFDVYSRIMGMSPAAIPYRFVLRNVGDDELLGGNCEDITKIASECIPMFKELYGFEVKTEFWYDQHYEQNSVFPPGCHAPFLSSTSMLYRGRWIDVCVQPIRRAHALSVPADNIREVTSGVFESVKGWIMIYENQKEKPKAVSFVETMAEMHNVGRSIESIRNSYAVSD